MIKAIITAVRYVLADNCPLSLLNVQEMKREIKLSQIRNNYHPCGE